MSIPSNTVDEFRIRWSNRFVDAITVTRISTRGTFNESTLAYDSELSTIPYTGAALIRPFPAKGSTADFGQQLVTGKEYSVFVPHTAVFSGDFQPEDEVTVDASALDPDLVGKTMTVLSQSHDSYLTRIELICRFEEGSGYVD